MLVLAESKERTGVADLKNVTLGACFSVFGLGRGSTLRLATSFVDYIG